MEWHNSSSPWTMNVRPFPGAPSTETARVNSLEATIGPNSATMRRMTASRSTGSALRQ